MLPWWFLVFVAVCFGVAVRNTLRQLRGGGVYILGERQSDAFLVFCLIGSSIIFLIILGITAAERLGFITNYAP
jgi:hypothetical protein